MTANASQIAADILAQRAGATEKQAAFIGRKLETIFRRMARHGHMSDAIYDAWIEGAATKAGASETIDIILQRN